MSFLPCLSFLKLFSEDSNIWTVYLAPALGIMSLLHFLYLLIAANILFLEKQKTKTLPLLCCFPGVNRVYQEQISTLPESMLRHPLPSFSPSPHTNKLSSQQQHDFC